MCAKVIFKMIGVDHHLNTSSEMYVYSPVKYEIMHKFFLVQKRTKKEKNKIKIDDKICIWHTFPTLQPYWYNSIFDLNFPWHKIIVLISPEEIKSTICNIVSNRFLPIIEKMMIILLFARRSDCYWMNYFMDSCCTLKEFTSKWNSQKESFWQNSTHS